MMQPGHSSQSAFKITSLGRVEYGRALDLQRDEHARILAGRESGSPVAGNILVVEHDPVLTVSKRATARENIVATAERLAQLGISVHETDRGGDITYHGPGQVVIYPIVDLNRVGLNLHAYMRLMEEAVIRTCERYGLTADREDGATGVWVSSRVHAGLAAKVCAMGVRVRRWVTMHGLALNVSPDMSHFQTIVPCGLAGRPVTSLREQLGEGCPAFDEAAQAVCEELVALLSESLAENSGRKA